MLIFGTVVAVLLLAEPQYKPRVHRHHVQPRTVVMKHKVEVKPKIDMARGSFKHEED